MYMCISYVDTNCGSGLQALIDEMSSLDEHEHEVTRI
jgi:hypothetical protein